MLHLIIILNILKEFGLCHYHQKALLCIPNICDNNSSQFVEILLNCQVDLALVSHSQNQTHTSYAHIQPQK